MMMVHEWVSVITGRVGEWYYYLSCSLFTTLVLLLFTYFVPVGLPSCCSLSKSWTVSIISRLNTFFFSFFLTLISFVFLLFHHFSSNISLFLCFSFLIKLHKLSLLRFIIPRRLSFPSFQLISRLFVHTLLFILYSIPYSSERRMKKFKILHALILLCYSFRQIILERCISSPHPFHSYYNMHLRFAVCSYFHPFVL